MQILATGELSIRVSSFMVPSLVIEFTKLLTCWVLVRDPFHLLILVVLFSKGSVNSPIFGKLEIFSR